MTITNKNEFIGKRIKEYRNKRKWTQQDLADRIKMKKNTISAYEIGRVEIPYSKLEAIAQAFEIKTMDLLPIEGTEEMDTTIVEYVSEVKAKYTDEQLLFLQKLIEKSLSLSESEREDFLKNIKFAVEFFDKK